MTGIVWTLDGGEVSGKVAVDYGNHKVSWKPAKGYDASNVKVTKDGQAFTAGQAFDLSAAALFEITAGSEPTEKPVKTSFGIVEIMLVIITIMVVIMAVIIALKLMRS